jgi:hypothetical protein
MLPLAFVEHVQRSSLCSCKHGLIIFLAGILPQLLPIYKLCTVLLSLHRKPLVAPADFHCPLDLLDGYLVTLGGFNQKKPALSLSPACQLQCKFARFMGGILRIPWEVRSLWGSNAMSCGP